MCATKTQVRGVVAKQIAHIYNQIATDGEDSLGSYFAKATAQSGAFALSVQTHYSQYDSQHAGSDVLTVVHTIAGPTVAVPWFVATDRSTELHVNACTRFFRLYAGVGYLLTNSNYLYPIGYGPLQGAGVGLERFVKPLQRFDLFGSVYYYPSATGAYGPRGVTFAVLSMDGGVRWRLTPSGFGLMAGVYEEMRTLRPSARSAFMIRDGPYIGFDF